MWEYLYLLFLWTTVSFASQLEEETLSTTENLTLENFEELVKSRIESVFQRALPYALQADGAKISRNCTNGLLRLVLGIRRLEPWAIKMLDASGKLPGGILDGTLTDFGSFDECLDITPSQGQLLHFSGQYCTVQIYPPKHIFDHAATNSTTDLGKTIAKSGNILRHAYLRLGLCTPSSCSENDVYRLISSGMKRLSLGVTVRRCEITEPLHINSGQLISLAILSSVVFIVLSSTLLDVVLHYVNQQSLDSKHPHFLAKCMLSFSLVTNTKKLLHPSSTPGVVSSLDGMRFITSAWIILGHNYLLPLGVHYIKYRRVLGYLDFQKDFAYAAIGNFYLSVDTFFLISGFLTIYSHRKSISQFNDKTTTNPVNFFGFIFRRYWRITPLYAVTIAIAIVLPVFGSGPLWHDIIGAQAQVCEKNWWLNLAYVQNFWHITENCMLHSWYLASSMQIHICSFFILWPLLSCKPVLSLIINKIFLLSSIVATGLITKIYDLRPTMDTLGGHQALAGVTSQIYIRPYTHMGAFCIGIALGYIVVKFKRPNVPNVFQVCGWCIAIATNIAVIYGLHDYYQGEGLSHVARVIYAATHRTVWALSIAWVIYICATGHGGLVDKFLSWSLFAPLGRLSFAAYLVHPLVILYYQGRMRERLYLSHVELVFLSLGVLVISYSLAYLLYVCVESPCAILENLCFQTCRQRKKKKTEVATSIVERTQL